MHPAIPTQLITIGLEMLFYILLGFFALHAIFLSYHWFTFGTSRRISSMALSTYLAGGAILLLTLATAVFSL